MWGVCNKGVVCIFVYKLILVYVLRYDKYILFYFIMMSKVKVLGEGKVVVM